MKRIMNQDMKNSLRTILVLISFVVTVSTFAQPSAIKKLADATFTLTTFKEDGSIV